MMLLDDFRFLIFDSRFWLLFITQQLRRVQSKIGNQKSQLSLLRPLVKRQRHDLRADQAAAHVNLDRLTCVRELDGNIGHAYVLLQERRWASRRNLPCAGSADQDVLAVASDP